MIKTPTLFILGAGASVPFGYPTGGELRDDICSRKRGHQLIQLLKEKENLNPLVFKIENFVKTFTREFKSSGSYSIDAFLERRPEYMGIGKKAIAMILKRYETDSNLSKQQENWYMYLFNRMKECSFNDFSKNKISFVTFNYDLSLDQFISKALQSFYGKEEGVVRHILHNIPIVHLYGQINVDPFDIPDSDFLNAIDNAEKNLKLIKDERTNSGHKKEITEEFKTAHSLIKNATNIYFLGFGFDETNLERLKIELMKNKIIRFTAKGLETSRINWIKKQFLEAGIDQNLSSADTDCIGILEEHLKFE